MIDLALNAPQTVILTEDECWMYLQATTMYAWSPRGQTPIVSVHPGREKVGFYGTLNLRTGCETVMRSKQFNAATSAQYLGLLLRTYPDVPLLLLWDRASWHDGPEIRDVLAAHPRLEIIRYPVAAPDLNPQEHVWKETRRAITHNHLIPRLPELADLFEDYLLTHSFSSSFLERYDYDAICSIFN
jgi:hypothetical protein